LALLHPYSPFITEEIRQNMGIEIPLIITNWPEPTEDSIDIDAEKEMDFEQTKRDKY
jgi:valyl-tRNA synthetase